MWAWKVPEHGKPVIQRKRETRITRVDVKVPQRTKKRQGGFPKKRDGVLRGVVGKRYKNALDGSTEGINP